MRFFVPVLIGLLASSSALACGMARMPEMKIAKIGEIMLDIDTPKEEQAVVVKAIAPVPVEPVAIQTVKDDKTPAVNVRPKPFVMVATDGPTS